MAIKRDKKEEEDGGNMFQNLDKTSVLQDARTFNDTPVNPRKCTPILTKILFLLNQGEQLGTTEATEAFFAMTKLFQSKNPVLRRMVYLGIKELSNLAEDVIIVTSSLTKDMTGKEDLYRAAAIRALCSITDATMLQTIERYMKQAIVDKNPSVASAALVSSLHMSKTAGDVVKRWVNEAQEALNSDNVMVQYHALGLLYHIRKTDRLAVNKLVARLTSDRSNRLKSPFAFCMLIRIACKQLEKDGGDYSDSPLFGFVEACLRHKNETVTYEAAAAMVNLRNTTARQVSPAVSVLQLFCNSSKPALRFAAVRTLNKVAMTHPPVVTSCNLDLENLITDPNRSIATLAITTLLKTGAESAVDRLMKQIASFVSEISDEFKIVVVQAIRALCLKFPRKHNTLMTFLSAMLRDEGGLEYKASIADTIITIIEDNPDAKEIGLAHLCEFIEDCEHVSLAVRILHLLGKEGPKTIQPSRYIRFIYNRVILEIAVIRAAAVSALAQFGSLCPDLLPNILVLLARCQMDTDDEVRDRATYYHYILSLQEKGLIFNYIVDPMQICLVTLEKSLAQQVQEKSSTKFDLKSVPPAAVVTMTEDTAKEPVPEGSISTVPAKAPLIQSTVSSYAEKLQNVPGLQSIPGVLFHVSEPVELTESETEYFVTCTKLAFPNHLVLQFECKNTLSDQLLENVRVQVEASEGYRVVKEISIPRLPYNETHNAYVILQFPDQLALTVTNFGATLRFIVKDCDPTTGIPDADDGYDDDYMLEDVEISISDQIEKISMDKEAFDRAWETAIEDGFTESEDTFNLPGMGSLEQAVTKVVKFLSLEPTGLTRIADRSSVMLCMPGMFRGGIEVLIRAKLAVSNNGVSMQFTVKSAHPEVAELICAAVG
ncbi:Coatomer subunit alpha-2 [Nesidiocoris tenuis]|uniref:Coatomer subunit gamma n=1 Tax=Nesidiocoris tenuis TaxID=355587 RepID=A0ABN7AZ19_9HEMI|nr:Coatomer subunit alpha-2 [Nesidiocoris tenuis]